MSTAELRITKTQVKMLEVLSDGQPHLLDEIKQCLPDELSSIRAVEPHLAQIRKYLRAKGEDILCVFVTRRRMYRHVRLLHSSYDGYR
jgi:hypothetical protein